MIAQRTARAGHTNRCRDYRRHLSLNTESIVILPRGSPRPTAKLTRPSGTVLLLIQHPLGATESSRKTSNFITHVQQKGEHLVHAFSFRAKIKTFTWSALGQGSRSQEVEVARLLNSHMTEG